MHTVSVIIPTYNHAALVGQTLASVFGQTFADHEVIVVNDGSPDGTAAVLRPYADAGRVRYVEQANAGQAAARNRGLAEATGEFVAFLDDDDLWPADKLAWQVDALRRHPEWAAVGGTCQTFVTGEGETATAGPDAAGPDDGRPGPAGVPAGAGDDAVDRAALFGLRDLFRGCPFYSPGQVLIRTAALRAGGGFDPALWGTDDYDLWFRLAALRPVARVERVSLRYRLHAANASADLARMLVNVVAVVRKHLPALSPHDRLGARRDAYRWMYGYLGRRIIFAAADARRPPAAARLLMARHLAGPALTDRTLARWFLADLAHRVAAGRSSGRSRGA